MAAVGQGLRDPRVGEDHPDEGAFSRGYGVQVGQQGAGEAVPGQHVQVPADDEGRG